MLNTECLKAFLLNSFATPPPTFFYNIIYSDAVVSTPLPCSNQSCAAAFSRHPRCCIFKPLSSFFKDKAAARRVGVLQLKEHVQVASVKL